MTDTPEQIPQWAMEKARKIVAADYSDDRESVKTILSGGFDDNNLVLDIARALASEREAATMAERERAAKIAEDCNDVDEIIAKYSNEFVLGYEAAAAEIAAAIRAGKPA